MGSETNSQSVKDFKNLLEEAQNASTTPAGPIATNEPFEEIKQLLKKPDLNIGELLTENLFSETMKQFRLRNKKLVEFLSKLETITSLLAFIGDEERAQEERCATELLTAEINSVLDIFCDKGFGELFALLSKFQPPIKNVPSAVNFVKITSFLAQHRSVEFVNFIKYTFPFIQLKHHDRERKDILGQIMDRIGTGCFVHLLATMIDSEVSLESARTSSHLRWTPVFVPILVQRFDHDNIVEEEVIGISDFIEAVHMKHPKCSFILSIRENRAFMNTLVRRSLDEESPLSKCFLHLLLSLLSTTTNSQQYETASLPALLNEILDQDDLQQIKPLQKLLKLLSKPSTVLPPTITTTAGIIAPLGMYRLQCVQMVLCLLKSNYLLIDNALLEHRILVRCIDLFFQYKWNNILHSLVESISVTILETKPSFLCLYLLRDCNLLDRIIQAQKNDEQEREMKSRRREEQRMPHLGYMGHLYRIANVILKSSKQHSAINYLLDDVPKGAWGKFVETLNHVNSLHQQPNPPPASALAKKSLMKLYVND